MNSEKDLNITYDKLNEKYMKRILTGIRTSGKLHLGHYVGLLKNVVNLQDDYEIFLEMADVQTLTDNFDDPQKVRDNVFQVAMDSLAVGVDPSKVTIFIQSQIPEIAELTVYFMNLVTMARLMRNPTVKEEVKQRGFNEDIPVGFVNYPISQAADIMFCKGELVPIGEDQRPMIEQTREIARKFNTLYGSVFPEPDIKVSDIGRLVGTDGNTKMSKSLGNVINLSDSAEEVEKKVMNMYTDPTRIKATDPGHVEENPVFIYLDAFGTPADSVQIDELKKRYTAGQVGDIEVKKFLVKILNNFLVPIRKNRAKYERDPGLVERILKEGTEKARAEAQKTLMEVKRAMKLDYFN